MTVSPHLQRKPRLEFASLTQYLRAVSKILERHSAFELNLGKSTKSDVAGPMLKLISSLNLHCNFDVELNNLHLPVRLILKAGVLQILAFPCDSWHQEQGSESEIKSFVQNQYQAKFPLFAKVEASGPQIHPIFKWLISNLPEFQLTGWQPKWNFSKWLVDRNGYPVRSYDSAFDLERLSADIAEQLQKERIERIPTADRPPLSTSVV